MIKRIWWILSLFIGLFGISLCMQQLIELELIETVVVFFMLCVFTSIGMWGYYMSKYMNNFKEA